jgi:hypothetical protein
MSHHTLRARSCPTSPHHSCTLLLQSAIHCRDEPAADGRNPWLLPLRLALPVRPEEVFAFFIATGEYAVMCMMERFADASREMGVCRGDDYSFGCFGLVFDLDNSSQRMFGFDAGLFIAGESDNLVSVRNNELTGEQQHPAWRAILYPFTRRAQEVVTLRGDRVPCPSSFMVDSFALTTHRRLLEFSLCLIRIVHPRSNRSIFLVSGKL